MAKVVMNPPCSQMSEEDTRTPWQHAWHVHDRHPQVYKLAETWRRESTTIFWGDASDGCSVLSFCDCVCKVQYYCIRDILRQPNLTRLTLVWPQLSIFTGAFAEALGVAWLRVDDAEEHMNVQRRFGSVIQRNSFNSDTITYMRNWFWSCLVAN